MNRDEWYERYAYPLYEALDATMDMEGETAEKRLALLAEKCPWLLKLPGATPDVPEPPGDEPVAGPWTPVQSSNLDAFRVSPAALNKGGVGTLSIRFKNGAEWSYAGIPSETIAAFIDSGSPGGFFAAEIKPKFTGTKIADADRTP